MMFNIQRAPDGMLLGVCKGIARPRELPVTAVRLAAVALTMVTGFWPGIALYILAAALVILVAANFIGELGQRRQPDGVVSIVTTSQVPEETVEEIRTLFETLWGDRNQDGITEVEVNAPASCVT